MADRESIEARSKLSMILMKLFYQIGINKKMRRRRRYGFVQYEELDMFIDGTSTSIFGSQTEGSTTPGLKSDIDQVVYTVNTLAVRYVQDAVPGINNLLMVADENTYPGYYKLQLLHPSSMEPQHVGNVVELNEENDISAVDRNQRVVLKPSSFTYDERDEVHGPATTHSSGGPMSQDYIKAIIVNSWLQEAKSWFTRRRHNNWITSVEFDHFLSKQAFLVPVGNPLSVEQRLEWRISFTAVERDLMWRMNNTQIACYILMKMINKSFIIPTVGECLSSYHCKTALFHLIDNTDRKFWKPNNLLSCLNLILKTISSWVESGFCPNYFIPNENMFLGKVQGIPRKRLHILLVYLIDQDFKYLTQIEFDGLGQALSEVCSKRQIQPDTVHVILDAVQSRNGKDLHALSFMDVTLLEICYQYKRILQSRNTDMLHTLIQGYQGCSTVLQDALSVLISLLCSHFGSQLASFCIAENRIGCRCMELAHLFLRIGAPSDVTTGRLKLAGFYLRLGYAPLAEKVLTAVEQDLIHYVSDVSPVTMQHITDENFQKIVSEEITTHQIFRSCLALSVMYLPSEIHCTPPPLCYEMFWSEGVDPGLSDHTLWLELDARPFLYFLLHQTYSALGMKIQRLAAFQNLAEAIEEEKITHPDTNLNLIAYCLRQEGQTYIALECLQQSLQIKPGQNWAIWQICDMLNEACNTQN
ncbi:hypothetical protein ACJMK2_011381 [Sinanodonta woodiana]|uniref:Mab-21-like HhH/H2TH-like domain-containing protein n=1 Tax=Sinanodonta woodiana TaxID=1069815 RepID=A0ABD3V7B1_SINWO